MMITNWYGAITKAATKQGIMFTHGIIETKRGNESRWFVKENGHEKIYTTAAMIKRLGLQLKCYDHLQGLFKIV